LALSAFFAIEGVFQIAAGLRSRTALRQSWGWLVMSGVADLALAAIVAWSWPTSAIWALGLFVGINLISSGLAVTMLALASRKRSGMSEKPVADPH
jgi:uncharacterized membrane protein HdeD (DUF308 family)